MKIKYFTLGIVLVLLISCNQNTSKNQNNQVAYDYGTKNDSALFYFNKGWEYIMDYGQWTLSEKAFRKAVEFDTTFLVGKSFVGKITQDLDERLRLWDELNIKKQNVSKDEQLLLEATLNILELFNARDQNVKLDKKFMSDFKEMAESNYREFVHKYPNESYFKAEYIEILHSNHNAQVALDSLNFLSTTKQKELPSFISLAAAFESDLGNYEKALSLADKLQTKIDNPDIPAPYVLYAQIYSKMDSLSLTKTYIDKAVALDTNHLIAIRLKKYIDSKLKPKVIKDYK